jgi:hypothetical protein
MMTYIQTQENQVSVKEKLVILLVIFLVKILKPWEYDHQFTSFFDEIKSAMNEK